LIHRLLPACVLVLTIGVAQGIAQAQSPVNSADHPQMWIERMNRALLTLNYEGTFLHLRHGKVETLSIVHRVEDRKVTERLVSLDNSGREIIRSDGEQMCFLPDQRRVLVHPVENPQSGLLGTPIFCRNIELNYQFEMVESERISGRMTRVIAVNPRDRYRFGYRLWLDEQTALPLKTQLLDADNNVIEQILFARLTIPDHIPKSAVQPRVNAEGFKWVRAAPMSPAQVRARAAQPGWQASRLPPGFKLISAHSSRMPSKRASAAHLVYSDGLASVSVFVEESADDSKPRKGPSRIGSSYVFSTVFQGHQVTAVGEVPVQTVRFIAASIKPEMPALAKQR
jgi:sigma-E factor negative regulatory protein RseB